MARARKDFEGLRRFLARELDTQLRTREIVLSLIAYRDAMKNGTVPGWRGAMSVPPASPLASVLDAFKRETNIALELPFFTFLWLMSGVLLKRGVRVKGAAWHCFMDLWLVMLSDSGAGKTFTYSRLAESAPERAEFPEVASAAKFVEALRDHNHGLWFCDEIAQLIKQIEAVGGPLTELRGYLLRTYDNQKVERSTKKDGTVAVDEPVLSILGLNTPASFHKSISAESMADGFAQRFSFVRAPKDADRPFEHYPIYREGDAEDTRGGLRGVIADAWRRIAAVPLHACYTIGAEAEQVYRDTFRAYAGVGHFPEGFFRRIMWRSAKYAVLYHILLGKDTATIDAEDMGWACRVAWLHLCDIMEIVSEKTGFSAIVNEVEQARNITRRFASQGKKAGPRDIQQRMRSVRNAEDARRLAQYLDGSGADKAA